MKSVLQKIPTGNPDASSLDGIDIDDLGKPTSINQVATITVDAGPVTITPWYARSLTRSRRLSARAASPSTRSSKRASCVCRSRRSPRRKELIKLIVQQAEPARAAIRAARSDALGKIAVAVAAEQLTAHQSQASAQAVRDLTTNYLGLVNDSVNERARELKTA